MARQGVGPDPIMRRALYIQDKETAANGIDELFEDATGNICRQTFESLTSPFSGRASSAANPKSMDSHTSRRLHRTRQTLGTYRHDLVVAMRVVNRIEREVVQAEYEDWLMGENRRCSLLREAISKNKTEQLGGRVDEVREWQGPYCESCGEEWGRVRDVDA